METEALKGNIGEMKKKRILMDDGRRYLIYYTFGDDRQSENISHENPIETLPAGGTQNFTVGENK